MKILLEVMTVIQKNIAHQIVLIERLKKQIGLYILLYVTLVTEKVDSGNQLGKEILNRRCTKTISSE